MSRHTVGIISAGVSCFLDIEQIRKSIGENVQHVRALDYTSFDQTSCKRFRALLNVHLVILEVYPLHEQARVSIKLLTSSLCAPIMAMCVIRI